MVIPRYSVKNITPRSFRPPELRVPFRNAKHFENVTSFESCLPFRARPWQVEITWPLRQSRVRPSEILLRVTRGEGRAGSATSMRGSGAAVGGGDSSRATARRSIHPSAAAATGRVLWFVVACSCSLSTRSRSICTPDISRNPVIRDPAVSALVRSDLREMCCRRPSDHWKTPPPPLPFESRYVRRIYASRSTDEMTVAGKVNLPDLTIDRESSRDSLASLGNVSRDRWTTELI